ncbi:MAG: VCBS repeat-containing protein [Deltaproteobacteria bacterium]|nr:VCBS repeat-containing protein [Candidatus Zymogenaceae bacterium]
MKKVLFLSLLTACLFYPVLGYEYYFQKSGGTYMTPTEQVTTLTGGNWDDGYFDLAISTPFFFYGKRVTHLRIWTNGYVTLGFGSSPADSAQPINQPIPTAGDPDGLIAPWWDDWDLTSKGKIWYLTNAVHTAVEWQDIPHKNDPTTSYDFELLIYSRTYEWAPNAIIFWYKDAGPGTEAYDNGRDATIGIEHKSGCRGEEYGYLAAAVNTNESVHFNPYVPIYDTTDFFGTERPDLVAFRPGDGMWHLYKNDGTQTDSFQWGQRGDIPFPGDFDGDGDADACVYRPESCMWHGTLPSFGIQWGAFGDIPITADFDGDHKTDLAVYRPHDGLWFIYYPTLATSEVIQWGWRGDIPLPADYDSDGLADCAVFRPLENTWYIRKSTNPAYPWVVSWGADGDIPFPAKNHGLNYANIAVFRPSTGQWFSYNQTSGTTSTCQWGAEEDYPLPNDWDGSGYSNHVVFRPSGGQWYIADDDGLEITSIPWGISTDRLRCRRSIAIIAPSPEITGRN